MIFNSILYLSLSAGYLVMRFYVKGCNLRRDRGKSKEGNRGHG